MVHDACDREDDWYQFKATSGRRSDQCLLRLWMNVRVSFMTSCDELYVGQLPCGYNIVKGTNVVWKGLGLAKGLSVVDITWSIV